MVRFETELPAIGILGGTFDPVHFGHLRPALEVMQQLNLEQMRLIPCATPPHRQQPVASAKERRLMLELAIKGLEGFMVDDRELHRSGPSYSVDTLLSLREQFPENPLFFLVGSDAFQGLHSWSRWTELLDLAHLVVMQRPEQPSQLPDELDNWYHSHLATAADRTLAAGKIWPLAVTQMAVSATQIRNCFAEHRSARFLMPEAVISLIDQLGLYHPD
ncbi:nicotinic acid mononucleotide adenylyltransferase [Methylophaga lonarensis MPL]|uniref:Probable nicotinate-nucleotide adenylyltransferase n=1 Tax=Methylophaga lonarensis MPL TaxID=1286106 RepID=M7NW91_9GAMM|nr:nicotinate-nucleotide adenylyltransferase [Methylophaga lonarensis]EMR13038.1 nicotinic acid mononucleotide adenylyltransferase [Methylophaga lonarensis MPL]